MAEKQHKMNECTDEKKSSQVSNKRSLPKDLSDEVEEPAKKKNIADPENVDDDEVLTSDNENHPSDHKDLSSDDGDVPSEVEEVPSDKEDVATTLDLFSKHLEFENHLKPQEFEKKECKPELCSFSNLPNMLYVKPVASTAEKPSVSRQDISQFDLKKNLLGAMQQSPKKLSPFQLEFYNILAEYYDMIYMRRTPTKGEAMRTIYTLHILNHILKSRAKIVHHNSKLSKNPDEEYRDQGFTRPTAVVLVPFRDDCFRIVKQIGSLLPECTMMNKKRFENDFGPPPKRQRMKKKPQDYEETFQGNIDDDFKIGLRIQNKTVTLYSEFYSSDLIIASPLGLERIAGEKGKREFDFLSSIEILVIDRADVLYQQNLKNFLDIVKAFNHLPKESHDCNFFRVRMYALDGNAKFFRQTVLISSVEQRWFESTIFRNFCSNYKGYLSSITEVKTPCIHKIVDTVRVCFRLFDSTSPECEFEDRFTFFTTKVLPEFKAKEMAQTLVYIPSYFDFTRLRNYFRENELSSVMVCEHSKPGKVAQARNNFFNGWRHFMLYTERAHFYNRYNIKGVQHVIFYQPPTNPKYFQDVNFFFLDSNPKRKGEEKTCTVVASKFDFFPLKHIVGLNEAKRMLSSEKKVFIRYVKGCE